VVNKLLQRSLESAAQAGRRQSLPPSAGGLGHLALDRAFYPKADDPFSRPTGRPTLGRSVQIPGSSTSCGRSGRGHSGGEPKCCKASCLDIALSVAAGSLACVAIPFAVRSGPLLPLKTPCIVRQRLDGLAAAAAVGFADLPLHVITPSLALGLAGRSSAPEQTLRVLKPSCSFWIP